MIDFIRSCSIGLGIVAAFTVFSPIVLLWWIGERMRGRYGWLDEEDGRIDALVLLAPLFLMVDIVVIILIARYS